jgi:Domain of unknown function (DUF4157)
MGDQTMDRRAAVEAEEPNHARRVVRRRLVVSAHDDPLEREADEAAARALSGLRDLGFGHDLAVGKIRRSTASASGLRDLGFGHDLAVGKIRRSTASASEGGTVGLAGGLVPDDASDAIEAARRGGAPLAARVRGQMETAFGADFGAVRVHVGPQVDELNDRLQARAFTTGADMFVRRADYAPDTAAGQHLLAHELAHTLQGGSATRRSADDIVRRYTDIPTKAVWKQDSDVWGVKRSDEMKAVDDAVEEYDALRTDDDIGLRRQYLRRIDGFIRAWRSKKTAAGVAKSDRKDAVEELDAVVQAKINENLAEHAEELGPLAADYQQAVTDRDWDEVEAIGEELAAQQNEFFEMVAADAMRNAGDAEWATVFCNCPLTEFGIAPFTATSLRARGDMMWLTRKQADRIMRRLVLPSIASGNRDPVVQMLQVGTFRDAMLAKASPANVAELMAMPMIRIILAAEGDMATKPQPMTIKDIADSAFAAFLGDQPTSGLGYLTNSVTFKASEFLLSDSAAAKRAPCMVLSNMMVTIFRSVLPSGDPMASPNQIQDMVPLLTKPLASIGTNGILTRETSFHGNVERYGDVRGYANVNRIFFGDGHEWLQVGNTEYDPTLGISGPVGTVRAQVEGVTYVKKGSTFKGDDGTVVRRNKKVPPGGAALLFQRSVTIQ